MNVIFFLNTAGFESFICLHWVIWENFSRLPAAGPATPLVFYCLHLRLIGSKIIGQSKVTRHISYEVRR